MQPYFFPYLGYFQLIKHSERFVFHDDVDYQKRGWINRNRILSRGEFHYITVPVEPASTGTKVRDIRVSTKDEKLLKKMSRVVKTSYHDSPYLDSVLPLLEETIDVSLKTGSLTETAKFSVRKVCEYLGMEKGTDIVETAREGPELKREHRVIHICKVHGANEYLNLSGGAALYSRGHFQENGIDLLFLKIKEFDGRRSYASILDLLMRYSVEEVNRLIDDQCEIF